MISNEHELAVTLKKLAMLQAERDALDVAETNPALRRSCRLTLVRLLNQLEEEISRYRCGQRDKVFLRRVLKTPAEAENTRRKLAQLEELIQARSRDLNQPSDRASLASLRRLRNKLKEQVLWYEAKNREKVHA
jgi:hypothetical protein